ncbi:EIF2D [Acanthosepion pharaonis]|uniref:EIF2D n=1 Tax=Acanthosepion pharaonis TaxID=158019 RepID=A0A812DNM0_ACAPH|nr:EIF2D [Sepia pharaonis]
MFKKSFRVKTHTTLKGSDRKKIKADILKVFNSLDDESLNEVLPNKGDVTVMKISTNSGENALVYFFQKNPMFFELDKTIFPTVYLLWKHPQIMLSFTTWPAVFTKLTAGADLMLPGLVIDEEVRPWTFKHIKKGDSCSVNLHGNLAPVAVGRMLMSGRDMYDSNMKGKGIGIIHHFGDELWAAGDKSQPPHIPQEVSSCDSSDSEETSCIAKGNDNSQTEEDADVSELNHLNITETTESLSPCQVEQKEEEQGEEEDDVDDDEQASAQEEMDELLLHCFLCALKSRLKDKDLPIPTVNFYRNHMKAFCSPGKTLEIKKSSYKKFSKFLQTMEEQNFIRVTEKSKGVDVIDWFDKTHPDLKELVVPDVDQNENNPKTSNTPYKVPTIVEMRTVKAPVLPVFKELGYEKGSAIPVNEVRNVVVEYVKKKHLQRESNKAEVQLDPVLASVVLRPGENKPFLEWKDLVSRLTAKMEVAHELRVSGQAPILRKGQIKNISIEVQKRMNNKRATIVYNLESFGIVPENFAHEVSVGVACSTSVTQADNKTLGKQVMIQGNQVHFVGQLLLGKYGLPRRFVKGLELAPKKGKRK